MTDIIKKCILMKSIFSKYYISEYLVLILY